MSFRTISDQVMNEITSVFARMEDENARDLIEAIKKADRIFTISAGREGLSLRGFTMRLMHLGKEAHWIWDDTTPAIGPDDLLIVACGAADCGHENYVAGQAKKAGAKMALITAAQDGVLKDMADVVANIPAAAFRASGDFVPSEQLMGNLFEQSLLIFLDIVVMMLREEEGITKEEMVARHRNVE